MLAKASNIHVIGLMISLAWPVIYNLRASSGETGISSAVLPAECLLKRFNAVLYDDVVIAHQLLAPALENGRIRQRPARKLHYLLPR